MHWSSEDTKKAILFSLAPVGAAATAFAVFVKDKDVLDWWVQTKKPKWMPMDARLYSTVDILTLSPLGYASYLVYKNGGGFDYTDTKVALGLYGTNLVLALGAIIAIKKRNLKCLFRNTALLNATAIAAAYAFYKIDKTAGLLLVPYAVWTGFYAFLTYAVSEENKVPDQGGKPATAKPRICD